MRASVNRLVAGSNPARGARLLVRFAVGGRLHHISATLSSVLAARSGHQVTGATARPHTSGRTGTASLRAVATVACALCVAACSLGRAKLEPPANYRGIIIAN